MKVKNNNKLILLIALGLYKAPSDSSSSKELPPGYGKTSEAQTLASQIVAVSRQNVLEQGAQEVGQRLTLEELKKTLKSLLNFTDDNVEDMITRPYQESGKVEMLARSQSARLTFQSKIPDLLTGERLVDIAYYDSKRDEIYIQMSTGKIFSRLSRTNQSFIELLNEYVKEFSFLVKLPEECTLYEAAEIGGLLHYFINSCVFERGGAGIKKLRKYLDTFGLRDQKEEPGKFFGILISSTLRKYLENSSLRLFCQISLLPSINNIGGTRPASPLEGFLSNVFYGNPERPSVTPQEREKSLPREYVKKIQPDNTLLDKVFLHVEEKIQEQLQEKLEREFPFIHMPQKAEVPTKSGKTGQAENESKNALQEDYNQKLKALLGILEYKKSEFDHIQRESNSVREQISQLKPHLSLPEFKIRGLGLQDKETGFSNEVRVSDKTMLSAYIESYLDSLERFKAFYENFVAKDGQNWINCNESFKEEMSRYNLPIALFYEQLFDIKNIDLRPGAAIDELVDDLISQLRAINDLSALTVLVLRTFVASNNRGDFTDAELDQQNKQILEIVPRLYSSLETDEIANMYISLTPEYMESNAPSFSCRRDENPTESILKYLRESMKIIEQGEEAAKCQAMLPQIVEIQAKLHVLGGKIPPIPGDILAHPEYLQSLTRACDTQQKWNSMNPVQKLISLLGRMCYAG